MTYVHEMESPIGRLTLVASKRGLKGLYMRSPRHESQLSPEWSAAIDPFEEAIAQLQAYFAGELRIFNLPLDLEGTPFQLRAWQALQEIPFGQTISYGEQAQRIGNPRGVRAIGLANGCNPVSIIVPCHRVIGKSGSLTGYGGGLERKRYLLEHEQRFMRSSQATLALESAAS